MIETARETELEELTCSPEWQAYFDGLMPVVETISPMVIHRLTHRILKIRFYKISVNRPVCGGGFIEILVKDIYRYAVPKVIDNYLKSF